MSSETKDSPKHWVSNNCKGQTKNGDGTTYVGDIGQHPLVAVG